ncbi:MAG: hypothetical protein Q8P67_29220 [archaeon]|nr:hypothetical protein [archaeon]
MSDPLTHAGFLQKQGAVVKSWKKRWFQVEGDSDKGFCVSYSIKPNSKALGQIALSSVCTIATGPLPGTPIPLPSSSHEDGLFHLLTPGERT